MKTKRICILIALALALICLAFLSLRYRGQMNLTYDKAYWPSTRLKSGPWYWTLTPSGINYNLYIPELVNQENPEQKIPLIVVFHGNGEKARVKDKYGRLFITDEAQETLGGKAAVLAVQSRVEYYSDPHAYERLIQNIAIEYPCIDSTRIAGWGFSQGAAFVQELAMYSPYLFKAVGSGSSYYSASPLELFKAARIRFWCATAKNDAGIYEQGSRTGKILSLICPESHYVEYEKRGHFYIELHDKPAKKSIRFIDWLAESLDILEPL